MRASRLNTTSVAAVLLAAAGLALTSCGSSEPAGTTTDVYSTTTQTTTETETTSPAPKPTLVRIVVVNGVPKGGIVRESVRQDDRVVLEVESDVADEVHLHGYDISRRVQAGETAHITFTAALPGRFEVELEDRGVQIAELTVKP